MPAVKSSKFTIGGKFKGPEVEEMTILVRGLGVPKKEARSAFNAAGHKLDGAIKILLKKMTDKEDKKHVFLVPKGRSFVSKKLSEK